MKLESLSVGVDLVELKKAGIFYREHRSHLEAFLNAYELRRLKRSSNAIRSLAEILAAKEALYKADGCSSGTGFENVGLTSALSRRVVIIRKGRFVVASVKQCVGKS